MAVKPARPGPMPTRWYASRHLESGSFRDDPPRWKARQPASADPEAELQWRVTQHVLRELGSDAGATLARLLGEDSPRMVQGRLSGEYRLRPKDLEAWSAHVAFPASLLRDRGPVPAPWPSVLDRLALVRPGLAWDRFASSTAALLVTELGARRARLMTSASFAYLALSALPDAGTSPDHEKGVFGEGAAVQLRVKGSALHVRFLWAPDAVNDTDDWPYRLHLLLSGLAEVAAAERLLVAALGPSRVAFLDVWEPPPSLASTPSSVVVPARALVASGAGLGGDAALRMDLLGRSALPDGGQVLVLRVVGHGAVQPPD